MKPDRYSCSPVDHAPTEVMVTAVPAPPAWLTAVTVDGVTVFGIRIVPPVVAVSVPAKVTVKLPTAVKPVMAYVPAVSPLVNPDSCTWSPTVQEPGASIVTVDPDWLVAVAVTVTPGELE